MCVAVYMDIMGRRIFKTLTVNSPMSVQNPYMLNLSGYSHDILPGLITRGQPAFKVPAHNDTNPTKYNELADDDIFGRIRRESTTIRVINGKEGDIKVKLDVVLSRSVTLAALNYKLVKPTQFESSVRWPELLKDLNTNPFVCNEDEWENAREERENIECSALSEHDLQCQLDKEHTEAKKNNPELTPGDSPHSLLIDDCFDSIEEKPSHGMRVYMNQLVLWKLVKYAGFVMRDPHNQIQSNLKENQWYKIYSRITSLQDNDAAGKLAQALCQELVITICSAMHTKHSTTQEWRKEFKHTQKKAINEEINNIKRDTKMNDEDKSKAIRLWNIVFQRVTNIYYMDHKRSQKCLTTTVCVKNAYLHYLDIQKSGYEKTKTDYKGSPYHRNFGEEKSDYNFDNKSHKKFIPGHKNKGRGGGNHAVLIAGDTLPNKGQ